MTADKLPLVPRLVEPQEMTDTPPQPVEGSDDPMPGPSTSERLYGPPAQEIEAQSQKTADAYAAARDKASDAADKANDAANRERMAVDKATAAAVAKMTALSEKRTAAAAKKATKKKAPTTRRKAKE